MNNIRKYGFVAALLAVVTILVPLPARLDTAFASETASDAIIQEARNEAEKLLAVRSAVWLKFLDEWNAYLEERKSDPDLTAPVFSSFIPLDDKGLLRLDVLLDKEGAPGYLPASFPVVNYKAVSLGNEIEVAVTPSNAVSATYVPNFLPMAEVSEVSEGTEGTVKTVKLRITRPGASPEFSFFVEKNAANEMGSAGTLEWVDGQGKIAVNELKSNIIRSVGTIEGRDGADISVADNLNLGNNIFLKTTGEGEFGTLSAADDKFKVNSSGALNADSGTFTGELSAAGDKFTVDSITGDIETTGGLSAAGDKFTVDSITGDITTKGGLSAAGGEFTVDSITGDITTKGELSAAGGKFTVNSSGDIITSGDITTTGRVTTDYLTIKGNTGTKSDSAYDVWVENANLLGGESLETLKKRIEDAKAQAIAASGAIYKTKITVYANNNSYYWAGTWAQFCALAGLPSDTTAAIMVMVPVASSTYTEGENGGHTTNHFEYISKLYTQETLHPGLFYGDPRKGKIVVPTHINDCTVYPSVYRNAYILK